MTPRKFSFVIPPSYLRFRKLDQHELAASIFISDFRFFRSDFRKISCGSDFLFPTIRKSFPSRPWYPATVSLKGMYPKQFRIGLGSTAVLVRRVRQFSSKGATYRMQMMLVRAFVAQMLIAFVCRTWPIAAVEFLLASGAPASGRL